MLIKQISVKNIRSYNDGDEVTVDVPEGVVLFEGDVGSGKSTLLYAIEFALFGFSDLKGTHLLSEGKNEGHVRLTFAADGKEYEVLRSLKRRGSDVVQGDCYVSSEGGKERLSPSDLKERIVAVLRFNEPTHPKAESLVYRYAIFTPQEQMKEILTDSIDDRLQVIRRVLGAQSYQVAADNAGVVAKRIKETANGLLKATEDLEEKKGELEEKSKEIARLDSSIPLLVAEDSKATSEVDRLEAEWKTLRDKKADVKAALEKVPVLEKSIRSLELELRRGEDSIEEWEDRLKKELVPSIKGFGERTAPERSSRALATELSSERKRLGHAQSKMGGLMAELDRDLKLTPGGTCPVCGQKIPRDFERSEHADLEYAKAKAETEATEGRIAVLSAAEEDARRYERDLEGNASLVKEAARLRSELSKIRSRDAEVRAELAEERAEMAVAQAEAKKLKEVSETIGALESSLSDARSRARSASDDLVKSQTRREGAERERARLSKEVEQKEKTRSEARRLTAYHRWLTDFFGPTVEQIEEQTLSLANARFNNHFQRFFTSLVDDAEMVVRVKEDFSPVFERQGFAQDFDALSGGERTSMAMAYRFALNSVVRESVSSDTELVILDEPTDGFSKEQVYRMRDLLGELNSKQVILVSHEKELESMADHILRVTKANGTSKVSAS